MNLFVQLKHWAKGSVIMETLPEFASSITKEDYMMSMDIWKGYRLMRLHPAMRDWFIFKHEGNYYQCIALSFGWGRSPLWFTEEMRPFVQELRKYAYQVLAYVDDFLLIPSVLGKTSTKQHCAAARSRIEVLMDSLGIKRHPGFWGGAQVVQHLGVMIDTVQMKLFVTEHKKIKVRRMAQTILKQVLLGRRYVDASLISSFCGTCISLMLAMPWARFYTRSLYSDLARAKLSGRKMRCRLAHQSVRDVKF